MRCRVFCVKSVYLEKSKTNDMDNTQKPRLISICTGYGGLDMGLKWGLQQLGIAETVEPIVSVEVEAFAVANLVAKMEEGKLAPHPIWSNLHTFDANPFCGVVDAITAGFPCQPFSLAGNRKGTDDPRHLWPRIETTIDIIRPGIIFLENVEGIITTVDAESGQSVLQHVCGRLERMGYAVAWGIFSASEVGASHQRRRVFIMADNGRERHGKPKQQVRPRRDAIELGCQEAMANPASERPGKSPSSPKSVKLANASHWPAPPGEPQHEWEEPRTVVYTTSKGLQERTGEKDQQAAKKLERSGKWKTKPQLGGAINGPSGRVDAITNRVDRLRMLGNGVVPQTAARAFVVLYQQLMGSSNT